MAAMIAAAVVVLASTSAQALDPPSAIDFDTQIRPILVERCIDCHGPKRQKGDLRLDAKSLVFDATREVTIIDPGHPERSILYQRITLPADDFDIMPAEGSPLSPEQIALIRQWITEGAAWPDEEPATPEADDWMAGLQIPVLEGDAAEREAAAIERLRERGAVVERLAAGTAAVSVSFANLGRNVTDDDLDLLSGVEPTLVWLHLAGTGVSDEGMKTLSRFEQIRRLSLQRTAIGDDGIAALAPLKSLRLLNLYGTSVTDAALPALKSMSSLRRVYVWRTRITREGAEAALARRSGLEIDVGGAAPAGTADASSHPAAASEPFTCCDRAASLGVACPHPCCIEAQAKGEVCLKCNTPEAPQPSHSGEAAEQYSGE